MTTKKFYQIRHKPTRLFLKNSNPRSYRKLVDVGGEVWDFRPMIGWYFQSGSGANFVVIDGKEKRVKASDFEIVEYLGVEGK